MPSVRKLFKILLLAEIREYRTKCSLFEEIAKKHSDNFAKTHLRFGNIFSRS